MVKMKKNCGNCQYSIHPSESIKSTTGLTKVCSKPRKRNKNGIYFVSDDNKCRDWVGKLENES